MLPKSLHTVRILAAVAGMVRQSYGPEPTASQIVVAAARFLGYPDASPDDPLIVKAAAQLAKGGQS